MSLFFSVLFFFSQPIMIIAMWIWYHRSWNQVQYCESTKTNFTIYYCKHGKLYISKSLLKPSSQLNLFETKKPAAAGGEWNLLHETTKWMLFMIQLKTKRRKTWIETNNMAAVCEETLVHSLLAYWNLNNTMCTKGKLSSFA